MQIASHSTTSLRNILPQKVNLFGEYTKLKERDIFGAKPQHPLIQADGEEGH